MTRRRRRRALLDGLVPVLRTRPRPARAQGRRVREIKVDEDAAQRDAMLKRTGGRRTVPQVFVGDRHVGGYDELYALDQDGRTRQAARPRLSGPDIH